MAVVPFIGYVRDQEGNGVASALVEPYALLDLNSNEKSLNPIQTGVNPDSQTGRWNLFVDTDASPTGFISIKITSGNFVRWIEGDATMQAQRFFAESGAAPILDDAITDDMIGLRTVNQLTAPTSHSGNLTTLLSGLANRIRAITGESNWYNAPDASIATLWSKFATSLGSGGHGHTGSAGDGPQISTSGIANNAVTEAKLAAAVRDKINAAPTEIALEHFSNYITSGVSLDTSNKVLNTVTLAPGYWMVFGGCTVVNGGGGDMPILSIWTNTEQIRTRTGVMALWHSISIADRVFVGPGGATLTLRIQNNTSTPAQAGYRYLHGFRVG